MVMQTQTKQDPNRVSGRVFVISRRKGKEYYAIGIPFQLASRYVGRPLNVTVELPDGERVELTNTKLTLGGGRIALWIPAEYSEKFKGVKEVDVVIKPLKLVEETS